MITITILGAGTAIPSIGYSPAAVLMQSESVTALFDMGPGALQRLLEAGVNYRSLQTLFFTHLHPDHTLDLVTFLQATDSIPAPGRVLPLSITGCKGIESFYKSLLKCFPGIAPRTYPLQFREVGASQFKLGQLTISSTLTGHTPNSVAYRVDSPDGSFVYTGDAIESESLSLFCQGVDLLICECSFPQGVLPSDHMNAESVGRLANQAHTGKLIATHFYPQALKVDLLLQIGQYYSGPVLLAKDGMKIKLNPLKGRS